MNARAAALQFQDVGREPAQAVGVLQAYVRDTEKARSSRRRRTFEAQLGLLECEGDLGDGRAAL